VKNKIVEQLRKELDGRYYEILYPKVKRNKINVLTKEEGSFINSTYNRSRIYIHICAKVN
jgi:hypothetical protein